jgi:hypothetical protein
VSEATKVLLDKLGGYILKERGLTAIKVRRKIIERIYYFVIYLRSLPTHPTLVSHQQFSFQPS